MYEYVCINSNIFMNMNMNPEQIGILIQCPSGQGKTKLLRSLQEYCNNNTIIDKCIDTNDDNTEDTMIDTNVDIIEDTRKGKGNRINRSCSYVDLLQLEKVYGYTAGGYMNIVLTRALDQGCKVFLIDNIDGDSTTRHQSMENRLLSLALVEFIDVIRYRNSAMLSPNDRCGIIGTATSLERVHASLLQPYRLGNPWCLDAPSSSTCLRLLSGIESLGMNQAMMQRIIDDCQGLPASKIAARYRLSQLEAMAELQHQSTSTSIETLSRLADSGAIADQSTNVSPKDTSQSSSLPKLQRNEPTLVGMADIQQRLSQRLLLPTTDCSTKDDSRLTEHGYRQQFLRRILDIRPCSGILIEGPPGSGKSALVDWLISHSRGTYRSIVISCADLVHKVVGESEQVLVSLFEQARRQSPCFLVLDNIDIILGANESEVKDVESVETDSSRSLFSAPFDPQLMSSATTTSTSSAVVNFSVPSIIAAPAEGIKSFAKSPSNDNSRPVTINSKREPSLVGSQWRRSRTVHAAMDRILSTLLTEIDGISKHLPSSRQLLPQFDATHGILEDEHFPSVIVVATTTNAKLIDRSLKRPGRLEEFVSLSLPNAVQRQEAFRSFILSVNNSIDCELPLNVLRQLADRTENRTYADLKVMVKEASMHIIRQMMKSMESQSSKLPGRGPQQGHTKQEVIDMMVTKLIENAG